MTELRWMVYGASGYTGALIAHEAVHFGLTPILAGRSEDRVRPLASELGLEMRVFSLDEPLEIINGLAGVAVVLHCAGPFSVTSAPMLEACLESGAHYLDITGEIAVFEHAHDQDERARERGIVVCPGVGFDVVPTDCVAASLHAALPDATHLALGFDSRGTFSPGTAKTSMEGLAQGGRTRRDGVIEKVPLAFKTRTIDFGNGEKNAMTIPWGDVSTAWYTTRIPNIEVYVPASPRLVRRLRRLNWIRPFLGLGFVQRGMKRRIEATVRGPDSEQREAAPSYVWGEARNTADERRTARLITANGYTLTVHSSIATVRRLLESPDHAGFFTPSTLLGSDFVSRLPGSSPITVE